LAIQIEVEIPTEQVMHSPTSARIAFLIASPTPSGPRRAMSGVPARFIEASSMDIRSTSGLCLSRISMSRSDTARYRGGLGSMTSTFGKIALASKTFIPVLIPRSRASLEEETIVAALVA
jgi:hypothetical protein